LADRLTDSMSGSALAQLHVAQQRGGEIQRGASARGE
jgi:hypothetical protein